MTAETMPRESPLQLGPLAVPAPLTGNAGSSAGYVLSVLAVVTHSSNVNTSRGGRLVTAAAAFGHGFAVQPLQGLGVAGGFLNGGNRAPPAMTEAFRADSPHNAVIVMLANKAKTRKKEG